MKTYKIKSDVTGMQLTVLDFGATITALEIPVEDKMLDIVLGFDNPQEYRSSFHYGLAPYFGAVVGRFAGRISKAQFKIDQDSFQLNSNFGSHHIHGGPQQGLSQKIWTLDFIREGEEPSICFSVQSPHLEEGYPGDLKVRVTYTLLKSNALDIVYEAECSRDTVLNLTQHSYFNLEGTSGDVTHQDLKIYSNKCLETEPGNIPTGRFLDLKQHKFDFSRFKSVPEQIDDAFVLDSGYGLAAELQSKSNGLTMKVFTDQPCVLVYVGGKVDPQLVTKNQEPYHATSGICFETQGYPDAPNQKHFPSTVVRKSETYTQHTRFQLETL